MKSPEVSISWGELVDKITILQIKLQKLYDQPALDNVAHEYQHLNSVFTTYLPAEAKIEQLKQQLRLINERLWDIEDQIRDKERQQVFDDEFIQLARRVYTTNDERARVKRQINQVLGSELMEEKSYTAY